MGESKLSGYIPQKASSCCIIHEPLSKPRGCVVATHQNVKRPRLMAKPKDKIQWAGAPALTWATSESIPASQPGGRGDCSLQTPPTFNQYDVQKLGPAGSSMETRLKTTLILLYYCTFDKLELTPTNSSVK